MSKNSLSPVSEHNLPVFSVGEISGLLKQTVEGAFQRVRVRGEISGFKQAASGHMYFALKDETAVLDGICWKGTAGKLGLKPEDGMEITCIGRLTTYPGRSKYQIIVESMELAGEGALLKLLEDRRKRLTEEGLFDIDRKQAIPFLPKVIGVITSPTGAVIRDILHRLEDRFPRHVLVWPVRVQGEGADQEIAAAINGFNQFPTDGDTPRPDLIIVARGGGSLEDLWCFNEEVVVRAAAGSDIPLISAVGHETDTTLIDFASDRRAPTPTAAAEMAVPVRHELMAQVMDDGHRLTNSINRYVSDQRSQLEGLSRGLPNLQRLVEDSSIRLDEWSERLSNALGSGMTRKKDALSATTQRLSKPQHLIDQGRRDLNNEVRALKSASTSILKDRKSQLTQAAALLESYSYSRVLERGFALVTDENGKPVMTRSATQSGMEIGIHFNDGDIKARVDGDAPPTKAKSKKKPSSAKSDDRQGNLL